MSYTEKVSQNASQSFSCLHFNWAMFTCTAKIREHGNVLVEVIDRKSNSFLYGL